MTNRLLAIVLGALVSTAACVTEPARPASGDGDDASEALGVDTLGAPCTAACGANGDEKCSMPSDACGSDLCLVDFTQSIDHATYCTVDCTTIACPAGWRCEAIDAFESPGVERACVAEPAKCGDGIVQLGEVCDGDTPEMGRCVDCQRWESICGDGIVQAEETCDGDTDAGYCVACGTVLAPRVDLTDVSLTANVFVRHPAVAPSTNVWWGDKFKGDVSAALSPPFDKGCDGVAIVDSTPEALRVTWTHCGHDARTTVTFSLPRADVSLDEAPPEELDVTVHMVQLASQREITWTGADLDGFTLWASGVDADHVGLGDVHARFVAPSAADPNEENIAEVNFHFSWTPPVPGAE